jgi:hypothetical protein
LEAHVKKFPAVTLALALTTGCGYVLHGSTQNVHIDTMPSGAEVEVDGRPYTTPVDLELSRGDHHAVTGRTANGAPLSSHIRSELRWRYVAASFFLPPIIGSIVDGVTGGDCELVPSEVFIPLARP